MIVETAVIGTGFMGKNHARVLSRMPGAHLSLIVDRDADRARTLANEFGCSWATDVSEIGGRVDAAILAVPTELHHPMGLQLLQMGLHLLIEKPIASTVAEAQELVDAAERAERVLAIGHIERFNPVCLELPKFIDEPSFIQTRRLSPYSDRINEGVIRDMIIHDVDLVLAYAASEPVSVHCETVTTRSETEDLATATVRFESGLVAQMTVSRIAQQKVRTLELLQRDTFVRADLLRQHIAINQQARVEFNQGSADSRGFRQSSMVEIPYLTNSGEPLWLELEHFIDAVERRAQPLVDGQAGLAALALCEQILESTVSRV